MNLINYIIDDEWRQTYNYIEKDVYDTRYFDGKIPVGFIQIMAASSSYKVVMSFQLRRYYISFLESLNRGNSNTIGLISLSPPLFVCISDAKNSIDLFIKKYPKLKSFL